MRGRRPIDHPPVTKQEHESTMRNAFDKLWNDTNKEFQFFTGLLVELRGIAEASLRLQALVIGASPSSQPPQERKTRLSTQVK